jgi:hypothetical protein
VDFSEVHPAKPGMVYELGNRAMQTYNERWRIGILLRGMPSLTRVTRWRGSGRRSLPKISIFLVVLAGFAGKYHQKRRII